MPGLTTPLLANDGDNEQPTKAQWNGSTANVTSNRSDIDGLDSENMVRDVGQADSAPGESRSLGPIWSSDLALQDPLPIRTIPGADGPPTTPTLRRKQTHPKLDYIPRAQATPVKNNVDFLITPTATEVQTAKGKRFLRMARAYKEADPGKYRYSGIEGNQSRLLYLKQGKDEDPINASLLVVDDDELKSGPYKYEALSYHWGSGEEVYPIYINKDVETPPFREVADLVTRIMTPETMKAEKIHVRKNLHEALKCLRRPDRPIYLWVDAICIWQSNDREKTVQVMKMDKIYRHAQNVCIWLGPADETSNNAMAFIKDVIDMETLGDLLDDTTNDEFIPKWGSLFQLLRWSWFSRRWVIQELALAKDATVHCGNVAINWSDFKDAISIFHKYFPDLRPKLEKLTLPNSKENRKQNYLITDMEPLGAKLLVDLTSNLFRMKPDRSVESTYGLETLVSMLAGFDTSDPRDTINSVRNICRELNDGNSLKVPDPNYSKNLIDIYCDFVEWVVANAEDDYKALDILCRHWALPQKEQPHGPDCSVQLPTWISTVDKGWYGQGAGVFEGRKAGEPFVGMPGKGYYNASAKRKADVKFERIPGQGAVLTAKGLLIGKIGWCSDPIPDGVVTHWCLRKLGWEQQGRAQAADKAPDALWRTLVADRAPKGELVPSYYHRACLYCLVNQTANGHINTKELLRKGELNFFVKDYLARVQVVTWNRVILHANFPDDGTKEGLVGLGPPGTDEGDVIAILFGCSVPVVLRPLEGLVGDGLEWYQFIGEAYVHGKMDGEAMFGGYEEKRFRML